MDPSSMWWLVWSGTLAVATLVLYGFRRKLKPSISMRLPPGPKPKPVIGNLGDLNALSHQQFAAWSREYGPLIHLRLGSVPLIVANNSDLAKEILKTQDKIFSSRPKYTMSRELGYDSNTIATSPMGSRWRTIRRIFVGELFTSQRIRDFQGLRQDEGIRLLKLLLDDSCGKKPVKIGIRLKDHVGNVVSSLMMSKRLYGPHADDTVDSAKFQNIFKDIIDLALAFVLGDYIPLFKLWDIQGYKRKMRDVHSQMDLFLQTQVDERRQKLEQGGNVQNQAKTDFLDVLLTRSGKNDEYPMTNIHIKGMLQESILGGTDTTSTVIEWTLAELMKNPEKLRKAQEELDSVVGRERLVDESDIKNLPYINAVIKESMRLHPVFPLLIPHMVTEDCKIGGFDIPAQSQVCVNAWAIGRDPKIWKNPLEFSPERFLVTNPIDVSGRYYELVPFGSGRRICPGQSYGLIMVQLFVAILLQGCLFTSSSDQALESMDMTENAGMVLRKAIPLEAKLAPRLPQHVMNCIDVS